MRLYRGPETVKMVHFLKYYHETYQNEQKFYEKNLLKFELTPWVAIYRQNFSYFCYFYHLLCLNSQLHVVIYKTDRKVQITENIIILVVVK